ncbi:hypothetical protein DC043_15340, partial [Enterococcus faecalis]
VGEDAAGAKEEILAGGAAAPGALAAAVGAGRGPLFLGRRGRGRRRQELAEVALGLDEVKEIVGHGLDRFSGCLSLSRAGSRARRAGAGG